MATSDARARAPRVPARAAATGTNPPPARASLTVGAGADRESGVRAPTASCWARLLLFLSGVLLWTGTATAHPIHTSLAEADYNSETRKLEVALRVFADDFEAALSARAKKKISLGQTLRSEFETLARDYVAERFTLKSADGTRAALEWIGRDYQEAANELWLFFEFALPAGLDGARLHHAVLSEHFPDQLNSVVLRDGARRQTIVFLASHTEKRVRFRP